MDVIAARMTVTLFIGALCFAVSLLGARFYLYMLQLSSYQFQGYFRFLRSHPRFALYHLLFLILLLPAAGSGPVAVSIVTLAACIFGIYLFFPRAEKKKFVITARVKRLMVIMAAVLLLLTALIPAGAVLRAAALPETVGGAGRLLVRVSSAARLWLIFLPLLTALANIIALPVEKSVQRWYINDAKRLIAEHPGLRITGITGSFGKTSVKHYLTEILSEKYSVLMTPGSFNTPMGVVRTIRENLRPTHEIFICEMGARHVGDIKEICDIVSPDDGIITAIGDQHLETFHTRENIIKTKYELLDAVEKKEGAASDKAEKHFKLVNGDDEIIRANRRHDGLTVYGLSDDCDYRGEIISVGPAGTVFKVSAPGGESEVVNTPLIGRHNIVNATGAIAMAHSLGVPLKDCARAARRLKPAEHRLEVKKTPYGMILDDAYNSNPAGARAALETLKSLDESVLKMIVTPGMVELGDMQEKYNAQLGAEAAGVCDYIIAVGRTNSSAIARGVREAGFSEERFFICATLDEAMGRVLSLEPGKQRAVLLENDLTDDY